MIKRNELWLVCGKGAFVKSTLKLQMMIFYGALVVLSIGVLSYLRFTIPELGLLLILSPIAFSMFTRQYDWPAGTVLVVITSGVLFFLSGTDFLMTLCIYGPLGISLGHPRAIALKDIYRLGISLGTAFLGLILWYNGFNLLGMGKDRIQLLVANIKETFANPDRMAQLEAVYGKIPESIQTDLIDMMLLVMPSMLFITLLLYVLLNIAIEHTLLQRTLKRGQPKQSLNFEIPQHFLNGATILMLGSLVLQLVTPDLGASVLSNVILMIMVVLSIQGIIVINHILKSNRIIGFFRVIVVLLSSLFLQLFGLGVIGWIDLIFDLRKRFVKR